MSRHAFSDGVAHEHRRTAGGRGRVERHDGRCRPSRSRRVRSDAELLGGDLLRAPCARPGPCRTCPTGRTRCRRSAARAIANDADAVDELFRPSEMPRPRPAGKRIGPADGVAGRVSERLSQSPSAGVSSGMKASPRCRNVAPADLEPDRSRAHARPRSAATRRPTTPAACRTRETPCSASCATAARAPSTRAFGVRYGTARRVARLADDAAADVGVRADQEVGLDVLKDDAPGLVEPRARVDPRRRAPDRLKRLLERQHETNGPAGPEREERHQRLELRPALAAEAAARIRRDDAHLRDRPAKRRRPRHAAARRDAGSGSRSSRPPRRAPRGRRAARWRSA